jgi:hypothetical protein
MPDDAAPDNVKATRPPPRTLADKVNWLISTACPADRGPYSNAEVAALIRKATGEPVTGTTIRKAEMLTIIRAAGITPAKLRVLLGLSPEARQLILDFVTAAARDEARHRDAPGEPPP